MTHRNMPNNKKAGAITQIWHTILNYTAEMAKTEINNFTQQIQEQICIRKIYKRDRLESTKNAA